MLPKPDHCRPCAIAGNMRGFILPSGTGRIPLLLCGEGGGKNEEDEGEPFIGAAGEMLDKALQSGGLRRDDFTISNLLYCFVSPKTSVFTPNGYVCMHKLDVGDEVLTHEGRFKKILRKIKILAGEIDVVQIEIRVSGMLRTKPEKLTVTLDHRFYTDTGWKFAKDLIVGDSVTCLGEYCLMCNKPFFRGFKMAYKALPFCSTSCHGKHAMIEGREKVRSSMHQQYESGERDPVAITKAAHDKVRQMVAEGYVPFSDLSEEKKYQRRVNAALARQALGINNRFTWIGEGEDQTAEILTAAGIEHIPQFAIGPYNYDFKIGNLIVEIDGAGARMNGFRKIVQPIKDRLAKESGYKVIHVPANDVVSILSHIQNDEHDYPFLTTEVLSTRTFKWKKAVFSLQVEDDESYVAQGLVNHNCRPPNNFLKGAPYEFAALNHCRPFLNATVAERQPRIIVALGDVPLRELSLTKGPISELRGYVFDSIFDGVKVIGTYHPSHLLPRRDQASTAHLFPVLRHDLRVAHSYALNGVPEPLPTHYNLTPTLDDVRAYLDRLRADPSLPISYDCETASILGRPEPKEWAKKILIQIQFSSALGEAIVLPCEGPENAEYVSLAKQITELPNLKIGFNNRLSDDKLLHANGFHINGELYDAMLMFATLQPDFTGRDADRDTADKGAPSKLLSLQSCVSFYYPNEPIYKTAMRRAIGKVLDSPDDVWKDVRYGGARDSDLTLRIGLKLMTSLKQQNLWQAFERQHRLGKCADKMSATGLPIDRSAQSNLRDKIDVQEQQFADAVQNLTPIRLRPIHPPEGYVGFPKDLREAVKERGLWIKKCKPIQFPDLAQDLGYSILPFDSDDMVIERVCKVLPFNPGSSKQVLSYIEWQVKQEAALIPTLRERRWFIPLHIDTKKPTTNKAGMESLIEATNDPALKQIESYKKVAKMRDYCGEKWQPEEDGRVHAEIRVGMTAIGQTTATNPPIQTYPKHFRQGDEWLEELGRQIKSIIVAPPGYVMIETDLKSFHSRMQGFLAEDADYYRLANIDTHSYLAAHYVDVPDKDQLLSMSDDALSKRLSEIKKEFDYERNYLCKRCSFLNQYGGQAQKAATILRLPVIQVQAILDIPRDQFKPAFRDLPEKIEKMIRKNPRMETASGCVRWFWEPDLNKALAQWVANPAHCHIQDAVIRLDERGALERYGACNLMHDALWWCCPEALAEECVAVAKEELGRPSTVLVNSLGAFTCASDAKWGADMNSLEDTP